MKIFGWVFAIAGAVVLSGCSELMSLHSFVGDEDSAADPGLAGTWKSSDDEALIIVQQAGAIYSITYTEKKETAKFQGRLIRAGDAEILDVVEESDDAFQIPAHLMVRVWPEGGVLRFTFLDSKWLRALAAQQLASQPSGDRTLITAPADAVRSFVLRYGADPKAFEGNPSVLVRQ